MLMWQGEALRSAPQRVGLCYSLVTQHISVPWVWLGSSGCPPSQYSPSLCCWPMGLEVLYIQLCLSDSSVMTLPLIPELSEASLLPASCCPRVPDPNQSPPQFWEDRSVFL